MGRLNVKLDPTKVGREAEKLNADLRRRVLGQDEPVSAIVSIYQTYLAGLSSAGRPIGNFLFLGPTGTGKTRIVEALAESLVGDPRAVIKIDCAEFQHSHEIAKLIGSPPGYLGHRETHPLLSQEVLNQYHTETFKISFVLFDEIEKASDALWNLLLGILDKGTLTLGDNRRVQFNRAMIFMTSNLGAQQMSPRNPFGFSVENQLAALQSKVANIGVAAARSRFTPEFINRLDKIVVFKPLDQPTLRGILDVELSLVQQRIFSSANSAPFVFTCTESAKALLLQEGTSLQYNARHLKRSIERLLVNPLSNLIATEQVRGGDFIRVDRSESGEFLDFSRERESMDAATMAGMIDQSLAPTALPKPSGAVVKR